MGTEPKRLSDFYESSEQLREKAVDFAKARRLWKR